MKELTLKLGGIWGRITLIIITAMLCGTAIFISLELNKTQIRTAELDKEGSTNIGRGTCLGGGGRFCETIR